MSTTASCDCGTHHRRSGSRKRARGNGASDLSGHTSTTEFIDAVLERFKAELDRLGDALGSQHFALR
jgi:hypothetical protein